MRFLPIIIWLQMSYLLNRHYNTLFYRWGKWSSETLRNIPKVPQVESVRARIQIQGCVSLKVESAGCVPVLNTGASSWIVTVVGSHQKFTVNLTQVGSLHYTQFQRYIMFIKADGFLSRELKLGKTKQNLSLFNLNLRERLDGINFRHFSYSFE